MTVTLKGNGKFRKIKTQFHTLYIIYWAMSLAWASQPPGLKGTWISVTHVTPRYTRSQLYEEVIRGASKFDSSCGSKSLKSSMWCRVRRAKCEMRLDTVQRCKHLAANVTGAPLTADKRFYVVKARNIDSTTNLGRWWMGTSQTPFPPSRPVTHILSASSGLVETTWQTKGKYWMSVHCNALPLQPWNGTIRIASSV